MFENIGRLLRQYHHYRSNSNALHFGRCNACGYWTLFFEQGAFTYTDMPFRNDLPCLFCQANARQRGLIAALQGLFGTDCANLQRFAAFLNRRSLSVYNAAAQGTVHAFLKDCGRYTCSEYLPDVEPGSTRDGVRCEDLQALTFPDGSFDLVITEDVLEHVPHPAEAFASIYRVLKPGGCHVFTVPIHGETTTVRVDASGDEEVFVLAARYHGDPLRSEGVLAYHDFGTDIMAMADAWGFETTMVRHEAEDNRWMCGYVFVSRKGTAAAAR